MTSHTEFVSTKFHRIHNLIHNFTILYALCFTTCRVSVLNLVQNRRYDPKITFLVLTEYKHSNKILISRNVNLLVLL